MAYADLTEEQKNILDNADRTIRHLIQIVYRLSEESDAAAPLLAEANLILDELDPTENIPTFSPALNRQIFTASQLDALFRQASAIAGFVNGRITSIKAINNKPRKPLPDWMVA